MKIYLLAIFIFLNILSLKAQSKFSKDIFLEKTIYSVMDSIKNKNYVKEIDTLYVNDATLQHNLQKVGSDVGIWDVEHKDTILHNIKIKAVKNLPYYQVRKRKIKYLLNYDIKYATDSSVVITYNVQKATYKKRIFKFNYINTEPLSYFTFVLINKTNLNESFKIKD